MYDRGDIAQILAMRNRIFYYDKGYFNASVLQPGQKGSATSAGTISERGEVTTFPLLTNGEIVDAAIRADGTVWAAELLSYESFPAVYTSALVTVAGNRVEPRHVFQKDSGFVGSIIADANDALWFTLSDEHTIELLQGRHELRSFPVSRRAKPLLLTIGENGRIYVSLNEKPWLLVCRIKAGRLTEEIVDRDFAKLPGVRIATMTTGPAGTVWFTDVGNNWIGEISKDGTIRKFRVDASSPLDGSIAVDHTSVWFGTVTKLSRMNLATHTISDVPLGQSFYGIADIVISRSGTVWAALNESQDSAGCFTSCSEIAKIDVP